MYGIKCKICTSDFFVTGVAGPIERTVNFLTERFVACCKRNICFLEGIHGGAQIVEDVFKLNKKKRFQYLPMAMVFLFVMFACFFQERYVTRSRYIIRYMFDGRSSPIAYIRQGFGALRIVKKTYIRIGISLIAVGNLLSFCSDIACILYW